MPHPLSRRDVLRSGPLLLALGARADAAQPQAPAGPAGAARLEPKSLVGTPGFFRVGRSADGAWWFVTPDGEPFFYRGVTAVNRAGTAGGRRAKPGPYAEVVDRKYDYQRSPSRFVRAQIARLRDWGFNAFGAWTTEEFFDRGMPYTEIVEFNHVGYSIKREGLRGGPNLPDVFDPAWERAADEKARLICSPRRESRELVGYFTDNELGWAAQPGALDVDNNAADAAKAALAPNGTLTLLQCCLSLPPERAAFRAAWDFARRRRGGTNDGVARAWGVPNATPEALREWTDAGRALVSPGYRADNEAFVGVFARRYFETAARLVRRYDPNHLLLGCRFGGEPGAAVLRRCRHPWVDVLSANNYRDTMAARIDGYYRATGLPVLIGEFAWASDYFSRPLPPEVDPGGTSALPMPERMLRRGADTLRRAAAHPATVGYTWYRWDSAWDRAAADKPPYGLVDLSDEPVTLHVEPLRALNPLLPDLHRRGATPAPPPK